MVHTLNEKGPSILDFAQLSLDVYNDSEDNHLRKLFSNNWIKKDSYPPDENTINHLVNYLNPTNKLNKKGSCNVTGFYARVYSSKNCDYSILAIRGSDDLADYKADAYFATNTGNDFIQARLAIEFFKLIKKSNLYISKPIKYVCGHSLGGIISKMIAPLTKVDVCAFNSPGVIEFLEHLNWPIDILENQKIVTYVANRDEVGELKSYAELGERIYLATSHKNQTRVIVPCPTNKCILQTK